MRQTKKAVAPSQDVSVENPMCERILGAAFKAFTENGYADTSTLEIATRAKVSKRDLYSNFGSSGHPIACIAKPGPANTLAAEPTPAPQSRRAGGDIDDRCGATDFGRSGIRPSWRCSA